MTTIRATVIAGALALAIATPAVATEITCADLASLVLRNSSSCSDGNGNSVTDAFESGMGTGAIFGALDVLGGLLRLGGPRYVPQATCIDQLVSQNADAFIGTLASQLASCLSSSPTQAAYVPILNALLQHCPSP